MNIIIPMAGRGTRVNSAIPKPLVNIIDDKPMIEMALDSLNIDGNYCFIVRRYDNQDWNIALRDSIRKSVGSAVIVELDYLTQGPAMSALYAPYTFFSTNDNLLIANCDQIMKWDSDKFVEFSKTTDAYGVVVTYETDTPKNSYAQVVTNEQYPRFDVVKEKEVISKYSLNGIHWWKAGNLFVESVEKMVESQDTVNGEYYIGPSYNYLEGIKRVYNISPNEHFAVGTLDDIERYRMIHGSKEN